MHFPVYTHMEFECIFWFKPSEASLVSVYLERGIAQNTVFTWLGQYDAIAGVTQKTTCNNATQ